jgi:hypothetical protein
MRLAFTDPEHFKHFTSLANAENVLSGSEQSRLGGSLGFMFYPDFQEVVCLSARVGKSVYALLGNTHFQILIRLQEGSETRRYGGRRTEIGGGRPTLSCNRRHQRQFAVTFSAACSWSDPNAWFPSVG